MTFPWHEHSYIQDTLQDICASTSRVLRTSLVFPLKKRESKASTIIGSLQRQMYYNNNTAQDSLLRDEIIENEWHSIVRQCVATSFIAIQRWREDVADGLDRRRSRVVSGTCFSRDPKCTDIWSENTGSHSRNHGALSPCCHSNTVLDGCWMYGIAISTSCCLTPDFCLTCDKNLDLARWNLLSSVHC